MALARALAVMVEGPVLTANDVVPLLPNAGKPPTDGPALVRALTAHGWDVTATAQTLGLGRTTLYKLMRPHGVTRPSPCSRVHAECSPALAGDHVTTPIESLQGETNRARFKGALFMGGEGMDTGRSAPILFGVNTGPLG